MDKTQKQDLTKMIFRKKHGRKRGTRTKDWDRHVSRQLPKKIKKKRKL